jgi:hypothetical protein
MNTLQINAKTLAIICLDIGELQIESSQSWGIVEEQQIVSLSIEEAKVLRDWLIRVLKDD